MTHPNDFMGQRSWMTIAPKKEPTTSCPTCIFVWETMLQWILLGPPPKWGAKTFAIDNSVGQGFRILRYKIFCSLHIWNFELSIANLARNMQIDKRKFVTINLILHEKCTKDDRKQSDISYAIVFPQLGHMRGKMATWLA